MNDSTTGLLLAAGAIGAYLLYKKGAAPGEIAGAPAAATQPGVTPAPMAGNGGAKIGQSMVRPRPPIKIHPGEKDQGTTAYVTSLYRTLYNREPDADGLAFWVNNIDSGAGTSETVYQAFVNSDEYKAVHNPRLAPGPGNVIVGGPTGVMSPTTPVQLPDTEPGPMYPIDYAMIRAGRYKNGGGYSY